MTDKKQSSGRDMSISDALAQASLVNSMIQDPETQVVEADVAVINQQLNQGLENLAFLGQENAEIKAALDPRSHPPEFVVDHILTRQVSKDVPLVSQGCEEVSESGDRTSRCTRSTKRGGVTKYGADDTEVSSQTTIPEGVLFAGKKIPSNLTSHLEHITGVIQGLPINNQELIMHMSPLIIPQKDGPYRLPPYEQLLIHMTSMYYGQYKVFGYTEDALSLILFFKTSKRSITTAKTYGVEESVNFLIKNRIEYWASITAGIILPKTVWHMPTLKKWISSGDAAKALSPSSGLPAGVFRMISILSYLTGSGSRALEPVPDQLKYDEKVGQFINTTSKGNYLASSFSYNIAQKSFEDSFIPVEYKKFHDEGPGEKVSTITADVGTEEPIQSVATEQAGDFCSAKMSSRRPVLTGSFERDLDIIEDLPPIEQIKMLRSLKRPREEGEPSGQAEERAEEGAETEMMELDNTAQRDQEEEPELPLSNVNVFGNITGLDAALGVIADLREALAGNKQLVENLEKRLMCVEARCEKYEEVQEKMTKLEASQIELSTRYSDLSQAFLALQSQSALRARSSVSSYNQAVLPSTVPVSSVTHTKTPLASKSPAATVIKYQTSSHGTLLITTPEQRQYAMIVKSIKEVFRKGAPSALAAIVPDIKDILSKGPHSQKAGDITAQRLENELARGRIMLELEKALAFMVNGKE